MNYLGFDSIFYNGNDMRGNDKYKLLERLNRMKDIIGSLTTSNYYEIKPKIFYFKNVFLGAKKILSDEHSYKNDGLIFTPIDEPYPMTTKWSSLYKWKPAELNTIDFYSIKTENYNNGTSKWELYVQHVNERSQEHKKQPTKTLFDISKLCSSHVIDEITSYTTFMDNIIDPTTNEPYQSNTVIEYMWDNKSSKFIPLRTRWDKTDNPRKHGNFSSVACDIWNNIHNPVDKETLVSYTHKSTGEWFEKMRKYHNKIKEYLYNTYTNKCDNLLELCSGRGGDIHKWIFNNITNVVGYDISEKNLTECERRIKELHKNKRLNYKFNKLDLCSENANNIILQNNILFDNICCQFGVHYMLQSKQTFDNLLNILQDNLKKDGYFIITFMDSVHIDNLYKKNNMTGNTCSKYLNDEFVYLLEKDTSNNNNSKYGNKIKITLNGNNILSDGSEEFIIDFDNFVHEMEKINLKLVETKSFEELYSLHQFELQEYEKDISFLNRFAVFQKTDQNDTFKTPTQKIKTYPQQRIDSYINFELIDLHKFHLTAYKINTKYDIVDIMNSIKYKYYKNSINNDNITSFKDIQDTFDDIGLNKFYNAVFIYYPFDIDLYQTSNDNVYFTYHKHTIEKKVDGQDEPELIEFDNWYILLFKNQILYTKNDIIQSIEQETTNEKEGKNINETNTNETNTNEKEEKNTDKILQVLNNPKVTIKQLRDLLKDLGLKTTGKKQELETRIRQNIN
jgi:hypothetical protein